MTKRDAISWMILGLLPVAISGCRKKQAKVVPTPPVLTAMAQLPSLPPLIASFMDQVVFPPSTTATELPPSPPKKKPKRIPRKPAPNPAQPATPPPAVQSANTIPPRITIDHPPTAEGAGDISVGLEHSDEAHQKQSTAQLLQSTENNLKGLTRNLTSDEQATVTQIRNFLNQSRAAITDNDLVRAHNLALKAHLLSDELVHR